MAYQFSIENFKGRGVHALNWIKKNPDKSMIGAIAIGVIGWAGLHVWTALGQHRVSMQKMPLQRFEVYAAGWAGIMLSVPLIYRYWPGPDVRQKRDDESDDASDPKVHLPARIETRTWSPVPKENAQALTNDVSARANRCIHVLAQHRKALTDLQSAQRAKLKSAAEAAQFQWYCQQLVVSQRLANLIDALDKEEKEPFVRHPQHLSWSVSQPLQPLSIGQLTIGKVGLDFLPLKWGKLLEEYGEAKQANNDAARQQLELRSREEHLPLYKACRNELFAARKRIEAQILAWSKQNLSLHKMFKTMVQAEGEIHQRRQIVAWLQEQVDAPLDKKLDPDHYDLDA